MSHLTVKNIIDFLRVNEVELIFSPQKTWFKFSSKIVIKIYMYDIRHLIKFIVILMSKH